MIIQEAKQILEKHLDPGSIQLLDEKNGIFRCMKQYDKHPYQILYVDCSNVWCSNEFGPKQLENYQGEKLLKDYYSQPGSLQWNYYYAFISSSDKIQNLELKKKSIEQDELYSRKLVLTPVELDEWLSRLENLSKPSSVGLDRDLGAIWTKELQENELDAIFLETTISAGVSQFLKGAPIKLPKTKGSSSQKKENGDDNFDFIEYIKFENYRSHPKDRDFAFGKVNLIKGVNGVGKTSLLDAIEILLCGKSYRNQFENTVDFDFHIKLQSSKSVIKFRHGDIRLYKNRDKIWYNNAEQKQNRLFASFNKYNYYNSDAAYQLSNPSEKNDVKKAFEDIALGEDVNRIEARIKSFKDNFNKELRSFTNISADLKADILKEKKVLKEISTINKDPEHFFQLVQREIKSVAWKSKVNSSSNIYISSIEKDIKLSKNYLSKIVIHLNWTKTDSQNGIDKLLAALQTIQKNIDEYEKALEISNEKVDDLEQEIEELELISQILEELSPYYSSKDLNTLIGLEAKISKLGNEIAVLKRAQKLYADIEVDLLIKEKQNLNTLENSLQNKKGKIETEIRNLTTEQLKLTRGLNQLENVINEILSSGREYIRLEPNSKECPLCHSTFPNSKLAERIQTSHRNLQIPNITKEISAKILAENNQLKAISLQLKNLELLRTLTTLLFGQKRQVDSLSILFKEIAKQLNQLTNKEKDYKELNQLKSYYDSKGLEESSFDDLLSELNSYSIKIKNKIDFEKKLSDNKSGIAVINSSIKKENTEITKLTRLKSKELSKLKALKQNAGILDNRIVKLKECSRNIKLLSGIIGFKTTASILQVSTNIEKLEEILLQFKDAKKQRDEFDVRRKASSERIKSLEKREKDNDKVLKLAKKACDAIDKILARNNKSEYLKKFIDLNKNEIVEIFKMIHAPKEFDDMIFNTDGSVSLRRKRYQSIAPLAEISSGQRSALALSIFSALNRKIEKGPKILMFDDPVINIDDLNVLSYFDYLREVAINGKRQIFFATANENLAFLFTQKFKFLDSDFVTIDLKREE